MGRSAVQRDGARTVTCKSWEAETLALIEDVRAERHTRYRTRHVLSIQQDMLAGWTSPQNKISCECHTKTPTYPVFRDKYHVAPCPWFYVEQLVGLVTKNRYRR